MQTQTVATNHMDIDFMYYRMSLPNLMLLDGDLVPLHPYFAVLAVMFRI